MIAQMDRTVPTDTILNRVWSESDGADPSYVWVTVRRLRRKAAAFGELRQFRVEPGCVGYRLVSTAAPPATVA
jgi:DNA-binding response OmpR family regulator